MLEGAQLLSEPLPPCTTTRLFEELRLEARSKKREFLILGHHPEKSRVCCEPDVTKKHSRLTKC